MPIYQFKAKCPESPYYDKPIEFLWSVKEFEEKKDNVVCPVTGCKMFPIIDKNIGVKFTGSGFYETDYKNKN